MLCGAVSYGVVRLGLTCISNKDYQNQMWIANFFKAVVCVCARACAWATYVLPVESGKGYFESLGAGVESYSCELPDLASGNWTQVFVRTASNFNYWATEIKFKTGKVLFHFCMRNNVELLSLNNCFGVR